MKNLLKRFPSSSSSPQSHLNFPAALIRSILFCLGTRNDSLMPSKWMSKHLRMTLRMNLSSNLAERHFPVLCLPTTHGCEPGGQQMLTILRTHRILLSLWLILLSSSLPRMLSFQSPIFHTSLESSSPNTTNYRSPLMTMLVIAVTSRLLCHSLTRHWFLIQ